MSTRHRSVVDLHLILRSGNRILLAKRRNTGYGDGAYGLPAGHLEEGEAATLGMVREAAEELCVTIDAAALTLRHAHAPPRHAPPHELGPRCARPQRPGLLGARVGVTTGGTAAPRSEASASPLSLLLLRPLRQRK
jgi:hypothetical protein